MRASRRAPCPRRTQFPTGRLLAVHPRRVGSRGAPDWGGGRREITVRTTADRLVRGEYDGRRYGLTRTVAAGGRSEKVLAEALDGSDLVSANLYSVDGDDLLKPCEMPEENVVAFLRGMAEPA